MVLSLIAGTIAFLAWGRLPGYNQTVVTGILISLVLIFGQGVYFTCSAVFQSFSSYAKAFWASLWGNAVALALVVMALKIAPNVLGLTLALVVGSLVPSLIAWYYVRDFINFGQLKVNTNFCKKLLIASFPTGVGLVINTIYTSSDRLLLSVLSTTAMLGFYGLAYKIFENVLVLPNFFMNAVFPVLVQHKKESGARLNQTIQKTFDALSLAVFPLVVGGGVLSTAFIQIIGGDGFATAASGLLLLFLGVVVYFYSPLFRWLVIIEKKEKTLPLTYGVGLISNIGLNLIAIPRFGIYGVAVVNAVSELLVLLLCLNVVYKSLKYKIDLRVALLSVCSATVMLPFVILFKDWFIIGPIALGAAAYVVALYFLSPIFKTKFEDLLPIKI